MPHAPTLDNSRATTRLPNPLRAGLVLALVALLTACGAAPVERPKRKLAPYAAEPDTLRLPQSLRLAALARVHQRAGFDAVAAEYFRGAYRAYPQLGHILDYAQASERARHFAEAHAAYSEALQHVLSEDQRKRIVGEVERLKTLVSPSLVPVAVQVQPRGTRVAFTVAGGDERPQRVVLGDGTVWLRPGTYKIVGSAPEHHGMKRSFRVGAHERQLLAVHLRRQTLTSSTIAGGKPAPVPTGTVKDVPETAPVAVAPKEPVEVAAQAGTPAAAVEQPAPPTSEQPAPVAAADPAPAADGAGAADEIIEEPAPTASSGRGLAFWGPVVTAGLGVAGLGAGGYFGYLAITHAGFANDLNPKSGNYEKNLAEQTQLTQDNAKYATWALIGGGAMAVAGTAWFIVGRTLGASAGNSTGGGAAFALRPAGVGFDGRRLMATWRF